MLVPSSLVNTVLQQLHGSSLTGHFGEEKTRFKAVDQYYWPGMLQDIKRYCTSCIACESRRKPNPPLRAPMQSDTSGRPFQRVAADLTELPCTIKGNRYILVISDYFTKYMNLYTLPDQRAETVAQCFF